MEEAASTRRDAARRAERAEEARAESVARARGAATAARCVNMVSATKSGGAWRTGRVGLSISQRGGSGDGSSLKTKNTQDFGQTPLIRERAFDCNSHSETRLKASC